MYLPKIITILLLLLTFNSDVFAQTTSLDVASLYKVADPEAVDGDILIETDQGLIRANTAYSSNIFGVVQEKPLLVYRSLDSGDTAVVRSGIATVNVTLAGGPIKSGDYITTSKNPGKGMKAKSSGITLGIALEDMSNEIGKIRVALKIGYADVPNPDANVVTKTLDNLNIPALQNIVGGQQGPSALKYLFSGLIVLGSLFFTFTTFARSIITSIEAIGRNPLAKNAIQVSILINAGLTIVVILMSLAAAYFILII